jgi:hypothetical protein
VQFTKQVWLLYLLSQSLKSRPITPLGRPAVHMTGVVVVVVVTVVVVTVTVVRVVVGSQVKLAPVGSAFA